MIYTTNAIESLNRVIIKAIKKRKLFPTDESVRKVIFLAHPRCVQEVDDAHQKLATGPEPFYDYVRRQAE
ncbi:MAG: hypothetical protein WStaPseu_01890 [Shewanella algae]